MNIEVYGALFKNKGAELMLRSICLEIEKKYNGGQGILPYRYIDIFNFEHTDILSRRIPSLSNVIPLIPKGIRKKLKIIKDSELDYILDASGFAYGDQWGIETSKYFINKIYEWKKMGCGVILMPQAFGPFSKPGMVDAIKEIHHEVDFMFVRDKVSFKYIDDVIGKSEKIAQAPDFTNLISGEVPVDFLHSNGVAIIPNCRMLDKTNDGEDYLKLFENTVKHLQKIGENVFFLIHEGIDDVEIANRINSNIETKIPIYSNYNALEIKGVIKESKFVISSRFHGLVSSLSQGIPCLGTGWSHKYQCLFEDYNYKDGLVPSNNWLKITDVLDNALSKNSYNKIQSNLLKQSDIIKTQSKKTWEKVYEIIDKHKKNNL